MRGTRVECLDITGVSELRDESHISKYILRSKGGSQDCLHWYSNAKNIILEMTKKMDYSLATVHLIDSHLCSNPGKYISVLFLSLTNNVTSRTSRVLEIFLSLSIKPMDISLMVLKESHPCMSMSWI